MNHLESAQEAMEGFFKLVPEDTTHDVAQTGMMVIQNHALIAIAEQQEARLLLEASKVAELDKIAEQLEFANKDKQEIHGQGYESGFNDACFEQEEE